MAINETSVDGRKYRQKTHDGWKWYSFITKAKDILFNNGEDLDDNLQTNLGAIKGLTTSLNVSQTGYAADASAMRTLNNNLNNRLTANSNGFYFDYHDGEYGYNTDPNRGADTFHPFSSNPLKGRTVHYQFGGSWVYEREPELYGIIHDIPLNGIKTISVTNHGDIKSWNIVVKNIKTGASASLNSGTHNVKDYDLLDLRVDWATTNTSIDIQITYM